LAYEAVREVVASAARTSTGTSSAISAEAAGGSGGIGVGARLNLLVDVTAAAGTTPTLDLSVEWSPDGTTAWASADPADAFPQVTAAAARAKQFILKAPFYRLRWTIGGTTPSFTFVVSEYLT
jgi:hypothetical protein